jgi:allophanate hydrolase subunit 2
MHEGIPPGGARAPELLAAANVALGNAPGAAALEHVGAIVLQADAPLTAATPFALIELGAVAVAVTPRLGVGYLAVPGGFDAPLALGGRGALLVAGVGRLLRPGDRLRALGGAASPRPPAPPLDDDGPLEVVLGPDPGDTAVLLSAAFTVSPVGDRVGVRLDGPRVAAPPLTASAPMVRGAIQATPSGQLVVLGPDHPTTGGYPVIAVATSRDAGRLLARAPGAAVRFREAGRKLAPAGVPT